ncbi:MAG: hypothetical protein JWQ60_918, partial [Pseudonocardia sp.]|nr:hypothetical protein [Pseudonocardia sp.]
MSSRAGDDDLARQREIDGSFA